MQNATPAKATHGSAYDGFIVEVGGQFVSEYGSLTAALLHPAKCAEAGEYRSGPNSARPARAAGACSATLVPAGAGDQ